MVQADFFIDSISVTKVIFGSDAESDAWESIYSATENNSNFDKLEFDVFKIAHHCSYSALNKDEKGDLITEPVEKVKKLFTGQNDDPDERLMRSIEEKIDIPDSRKDDFRREIMNYIGALSIDGKKFDYKTNERLYKALELKLFEDQKDTIKLTSLVSNVVDQEAQKKIDVVKGRLIKNYGYDEESATDVLHYVASIFARGDTKEG